MILLEVYEQEIRGHQSHTNTSISPRQVQSPMVLKDLLTGLLFFVEILEIVRFKHVIIQGNLFRIRLMLQFILLFSFYIIFGLHFECSCEPFHGMVLGFLRVKSI